MNEIYYIVVDIGCLECGEESHVLGIFTVKQVAVDTLNKFEEIQKHHWQGQHSFKLFEIDEIDKVYPADYLKTIEREEA